MFHYAFYSHLNGMYYAWKNIDIFLKKLSKVSYRKIFKLFNLDGGKISYRISKIIKSKGKEIF